jgi:hypothetical protein
MRNPFSSWSTTSGSSYLPLPLDNHNNKGPATSSSVPNLTKRAWNLTILACIALSTVGVYVWLLKGEDDTGPDVGLGLNVEMVKLERVGLADLGQEAEDRYHLLGERMDE